MADKMDELADEVEVVAWRTSSGYEARLTNDRGLITFEDSVASLTATQLGAEHTREATAPSIVWRNVWTGAEPLEDALRAFGEGVEADERVMVEARVNGALRRVWSTRAEAEEDVAGEGRLHPIPEVLARHLQAEPFVMLPLVGVPAEAAAPKEWRGPLAPGWRLLRDSTVGGALEAIMDERARQRVKWSVSHDDLHHLSELAALASHYITRGALSAMDRDPRTWWRPFVQGAALCVAALEAIHRKAYGQTHKEAVREDIKALEAAGYTSTGLNVWEQLHANGFLIRIVARLSARDGVAWRLSIREELTDRVAVSHALYKRAAGAIREAAWRCESGALPVDMVTEDYEGALDE